MNPVVVIAKKGDLIEYARHAGGRESTDVANASGPMSAEDVELLRTNPEALLGPAHVDATSALDGAMLDLAVARALAKGGATLLASAFIGGDQCFIAPGASLAFHPSTSHAAGGPIADDHGVEIVRDPAGWLARTSTGAQATGRTRLIASMRAVVRQHLGDSPDLA